MGDAKTYKMYIGGEWADATDGQTRKIVSPANGDVIAEVPEASAADVDRAVAAARKTYDETWSDATPGERSRALLRMADLVEEHGDELGRLESENVGKVLALTMSEEIPVIADQFRFFAAGARVLSGLAAGEYMKGFTSILRREPIGVAGLIAPWNYPLVHVRVEDRAGARRREHRGDQAGREHAAHAAPVRPAGRRGRDLPARRVQRRDGRRRPGRRGDRQEQGRRASSRSRGRARPAS